MFNLDLGLFNLRDFPLVTEVFNSKRLFEGMPSNSSSILNKVYTMSSTLYGGKI